MAKNYVLGDVFVDENGGQVADYRSDNNKCFLVIARAGYAGHGYYMPIAFSVYCKDANAAIERVKAIPRMKRNQKDAILDVFEISQLESFIIQSINDHDPYLRGYEREGSDEVLSRRLMSDFRVKEILQENEGESDEILKSYIMTADMFDEEHVLQRYFGPRIQGGKLTYLKKYDKKKMLEEYISSSILRYGVRRADVYFMAMYYQIYGKNNSLGLFLKDKKFHFKEKDGTRWTFPIDDVYYEKIVESGIIEKDKQLEQEENKEFQTGNVNRVSALDKFNARMNKHRKKVGEDMAENPGIPQMS